MTAKILFVLCACSEREDPFLFTGGAITERSNFLEKISYVNDVIMNYTCISGDRRRASPNISTLLGGEPIHYKMKSRSSKGHAAAPLEPILINFDNNERNVVCEVMLIEQGQHAANQPDQNESNNTPQCPYCNSAARQFVGTKDFNRRTTDLTFQYFQCKKCGLVFMDPIPADMRPFYEGGYQKIPNTLSELRAIAETEKYRMKPILKYKNGGRLLEIGPWMGVFSCNAKDAGFDVTAIDIDENCIRFLNNVVGVRALQSSDPAETLGQIKEKFDVIAMWHCLEHLPNPWTVIQRAAERLAPGGVLLVAIPNIESYEFSALGAAWKHLDAPRHLHFYPAESLVTLCRVNGLKAVELTTTDELSDALSRDAWYSWAAAKIPVKYIRGVIGLVTYFYARNRAKNKPSCGSGLTAVFQCPHPVAPPGLSSL